jgi:hypothetical protein
MAQGTRYLSPEAGWTRVEASTGTVTAVNMASYNGAGVGFFDDSGNKTDGTITFTFRGTALRLLAYEGTDRSANCKCTIDGVTETFSQNTHSGSYYASYEKLGLSDTLHTVVVGTNTAGSYTGLVLTAYDYIPHVPNITDYGTKRTTLNSLTVGDYIECEYTASSGAAGTFANLGAATKSEIPVAGSATPDGKFNLICVERKAGKGGLLIADRPVQHSISWDNLNAAGLIEGKPYTDASLMTGLTNVATQAKYIGNNYPGSAGAFDGIADVWNSSSTWRSNLTDGTGWLGQDFGAGNSKIIKSYFVRSCSDAVTYPTQEPGQWRFEASNTGAWAGEQVILASHSATKAWGNGEIRVFPVDNSTAYRYYRINILKIFDGSAQRAYCGDAGMFETGIPGTLIRSISGGNAYADLTFDSSAQKVSPVLTSNTSSSLGTASTSCPNYPTFAWLVFNGTLGAGSYFDFINEDPTTAERYLQFQYNTPTVVNMYTLTSSITASAGYSNRVSKWRLLASNDGTNWVTLDTVINDPLNVTGTYVQRFNNSTAYSYYRVRIDDTPTRADYIISEIAFYYSTNPATYTMSTTDKGYGAYPTNNEWDTHIVKSTLGGKITAGDNNVWNWNATYPIVRETPIISMNTSDRRMRRYGTAIHGAVLSTAVLTDYTLRPVLEFSEDGSIFL